MDADGYPTDDELEAIRNVEAGDFRGMVEAIKPAWWMPDFGFDDRGDELHLSTGGWSGNESVIEAMQDAANDIWWMFHWYQSRRGGHYIFTKQGREPKETP
jgi:hypothetical protein